MEIVMKSHHNPFNPDSYIFLASFTTLYFVSQVVIQMRWEVSYTYDFMYQLVLYMILFSIFIVYFVTYLFSNEK